MNSLVLAALCHLAVLGVLSAVARLASTALILHFVRRSKIKLGETNPSNLMRVMPP
jgi:hypothetical protein